MVHPITKELSEEERIALASSIKMDMIYTLEHDYPAFSILTAPIDGYAEQLFGPKSAMELVQKFTPTPTTRRNVAAYIAAAAHAPTEAEIRALVSEGKKAEAGNRAAYADTTMDHARQHIIDEVGEENAAAVLTYADRVIREERKLLTALVAYGNAYTDCALDLPTPNKEDRLKQSKKDIKQIIGQAGWEEFINIIERRVDYQLDFYEVKSPPSFKKRAAASKAPPEQGNIR